MDSVAAAPSTDLVTRAIGGLVCVILLDASQLLFFYPGRVETLWAWTLQPEASALKSIAGRGMLVEVRGRYLPLLELGRLTGTEAAAPYDQGLLMVLEAEGNQVALLVDALVGQEQVVIKSLESNYRKVNFIAGATILGEGRVVLILDVASLVRSARE